MQFVCKFVCSNYYVNLYGNAPKAKTGTRGDLPIVQTGIVPSSAKYTCTGIQTGGQGGEMGNRTWPMISAGSVPEFCVFLSN